MREVPNELFLYPRILIFVVYWTHNYDTTHGIHLDADPHNVLDTLKTLRAIREIWPVIHYDTPNPSGLVTFGIKPEYAPYNLSKYINGKSQPEFDNISPDQVRFISAHSCGVYLGKGEEESYEEHYNKNTLLASISEFKIEEIRKTPKTCSYEKMKASFWRFITKKQEASKSEFINFSLTDYENLNPPKNHWLLLYILHQHTKQILEIISFSPNKEFNSFNIKVKIIKNPYNIDSNKKAKEVKLGLSVNKHQLIMDITCVDNTQEHVEIKVSKTELKLLLGLKNYFTRPVISSDNTLEYSEITKKIYDNDTSVESIKKIKNIYRNLNKKILRETRKLIINTSIFTCDRGNGFKIIDIVSFSKDY